MAAQGAGGNQLVGVPAPTAAVYRLARLGADPFSPPPWEFSGNNRFDDPRREFRVVYCASGRAGAFGETLSRFRRSLPLLALLAEIDDEQPLTEALDGVLDPMRPEQGIVPADWRFKRQLGVTFLDPTLLFADIVAVESVDHLRTALAPVATRLGLREFDLSTVLGSERVLTQHCSRYVYEQFRDDGQPRFAGIRYPSRLNLDWTCWATFDDRLQHQPQQRIIPLNRRDPGLLEAAQLLGLIVE